MENLVIEYAAPSWAPSVADHGVEGQGSIASGSVVRSIADATGPWVGKPLAAGARPSREPAPARSSSWRMAAREVAERRNLAARVTDLTGPRPDAAAGTGITAAELTAKVSVAVAEADRRLARAAKRSGGPLPQGLQEVCLEQMRALAEELFTVGIGSTVHLDDAALPTDPATRRWLERPGDWTWITDWQTLFDQADQLGVGGAAFVVEGRPGASSHMYALVNTTQGRYTADPGASGEGVFPTPGARTTPPFEVRALFVQANGQVARREGDAHDDTREQKTALSPKPGNSGPDTEKAGAVRPESLTLSLHHPDDRSPAHRSTVPGASIDRPPLHTGPQSSNRDNAHTVSRTPSKPTDLHGDIVEPEVSPRTYMEAPRPETPLVSVPNQRGGDSSAASGQIAEALAAVDWQDSSYSTPDQNGVKACVSITVIRLELGVSV